MNWSDRAGEIPEVWLEDAMRAHIISVSGGKDSTALLLLALEREMPNLSAVFADTGHEHPMTYEYVDYLEQETGVAITRVKASFAAQIAKKREFIVANWPEDRIERALELLVPTGIPMLDLCLWKGRMPSTKARFCTQELKVLPILKRVLIPKLKEFGKVWSWQGVRAGESRARAKLPVIDRDGDLPRIYNYRPILSWSSAEVFEMHAKHGIKPNPLYKLGMNRVGCMPCIHSRKSELAEISRRFPEEIDRVAQWEALVSQVSKMGSTTWINTAAHSKTDDSHYTTHGIHEAARWAKTTRGGKQFDLLNEAEEIPSCRSAYGLCET